jgi:hypothetical protein
MDTTAPLTTRSRLRWFVPVVVLAGLVGACRPPGGGGTIPTRSTAPGPTDPTPTGPGGGGGSLPPVTSTTGNGPFSATMETIAGNVVFRPTTLGANGLKHPVFVWGTGAGAAPSQYRDHFTQMASHGFVIVSPNKTMKTGTDMRNSYNWIVGQANGSGAFGGKIDTGNIAMGGHSQGSTSTFDAEGSVSLKTSIHIAGGSFDGQGSSKVRTPTAYMCGGAGDIAKTNCDRDYAAMRNGGPPLYYAVLSGVGHIDAARRANPAMIAWLRWHLGGETQWKRSFEAGGQFATGIYQAQRKNWV